MSTITKGLLQRQIRKSVEASRQHWENRTKDYPQEMFCQIRKDLYL